MFRCSIRARAVRPPPSSSAVSATCCSPGKTKRCSRVKELGPDKFEIVVSLAEHPGRAAGRGGGQSRGQARARARSPQAYLEYLYTPEGQEIAAKNFYRPRLQSVAKKYASTFPEAEAVRRSARVRRLAEERRRRSSPTAAFRPDLSAGAISARMSRRTAGDNVQTAQHPARLRPVARLHGRSICR